MSLSYLDSILQQPESLRALAARYREAELPPGLLEPGNLMLTGMGASFHACAITATAMREAGRLVGVLEATELLATPKELLRTFDTVVYASQSGDSAEVVPLLEQLGAFTLTAGITNNTQSKLGTRAGIVLPLAAGDESFVATKTYVHSLVLTWLLSRHWLGLADGSELDAPLWLADQIETLIDGRAQITAQWVDTLNDVEDLVFVGHGPAAITARHAAMMCCEWPKIPARAFGAGAFRHGPIESIGPKSGVVIFAPTGPFFDVSVALGRELEGYGVRTLIVNHGRTHTPASAMPDQTLDVNLVAALDAIPAQLFSEAVARVRNVPAGFRYIAKVVTKL
jgi:glutamine---fructose-6-phosphate transaminase (isomerizing)